MTPAEWARCLSLMAALWPAKPVEQPTAEAWYPLLADLPGEAVTDAIRRVALEPGNEWPPTVGQIRAHALPPARPWEDALAELRDTVARVGSYSPAPELGDAALGAVVRAYGWRAVCSLDLAQPAVRAQVRDCYLRAQQHGAEVERAQLAAGVRHRALSGLRPVGELLSQVVGGGERR